MEILYGFLNVLLTGVGEFLVKYLLSVQGKEVEVIQHASTVYTNPDTVWNDLGVGVFSSTPTEGNK